MPMTAPKPESNYELAPAGTHVARLYKLINLGTHTGEYQGKPKTSMLIRLYWELPNEMKEYEKDGQKVQAPFAISRELTFSMSDKGNLRPLVEGMIGRPFLTDDEAYAFDIETLVGKACLINVVHKQSASGNTYANVASASPLVKGMEAPAQHNPSEILDTTTMSEEDIGKLPQWLRDKVRESHEYKARGNTTYEEIQNLDPEQPVF